jgi:hypothetical protein
MLRKFFTLLIILVVIPVFSFASTESELLVSEGRQLLFNAGTPTYQGILDADEKFALAVTADENDPEARLFRAITRLGAFVLATSDGSELSTIADIIQAMGIPIFLDTQIGIDPPFGKPPELAGNLNLPETTPNGDEVRSVMGSGLVGAIELSLEDLGLIDYTINVVLTRTETGDFADTEVDYTDVLLARAALTAVKTAVLIITAYDFDEADIREFMALANSGMMDLHPNMINELLAKYPNFLRLADNGATLLSDAKIAFQSVHDLLGDAQASLLSESDPQEDDLFSFESEADEQECENLLSGLGELMASLDENRPARIQATHSVWDTTFDSDGTTTTLELHLDADLLGLLGNESMIRNGSSFSGQIDSFDIYGGRVSYWKITQNGADRNIRILLDYLGYQRLELTGVLTEDDTVLTGTCSFQTKEGFIYTETKRSSFVASQTGSEEEDGERFDLNALFGNTSQPVKTPLVIRDVLPDFDAFGEPLAGTFPTLAQSEVVLNGFFPDFNNAGLSEELELELSYQTFAIPEATVDIANHPGTWPDVTHVTEDLNNDGYIPDGIDIKDIYIAKDDTYLYMGMSLGSAPLEGQQEWDYIAYEMDFRKDGDDWYHNAVSFRAEYANYESKWHVTISKRSANGEESTLEPYKEGYVHAGNDFIAWRLPLSAIDSLEKFGGWNVTSGTWSNLSSVGDWVDRTTKLEPVYSITGSVDVPVGYTGGKIYLYLFDSETPQGDPIVGTYIDSTGSFELKDAPYSLEPLYLHVFWDKDGNGIPNSGDYAGMTSFSIQNNFTVPQIDLTYIIPPLDIINTVSVKSVHSGDNQFRTFFEVEIKQDYAGDMPGEIDTITITAPDGNAFQMYPGNGAYWDAQWNDFFLEVPGNPQIGEYVFTVTARDGSIGSKSDTQKDLITIPIVDVNTVKIDTGSTTPVISWDGVSAPGTGITYRLEIIDMAGDSVFRTGRDWNMTACAVPESRLQPGTQYQYRIRAMDESDWIQIDNRSHTQWMTFTMDNSLGHSAVPAMELDGWGAVAWSHVGSTPGMDLSVKVLDHDGIAYDRSTHFVYARPLDVEGNLLGNDRVNMNLDHSENGIQGYYYGWVDAQDITSDMVGVRFFVEDPEGNESILDDMITGPDMVPPLDIKLERQVNGTTPTFTWSAVSGAGYYRIRIYDETRTTTIARFSIPIATSYTIPPGFLDPETTYQYRLEARDGNWGFETDHNIVFPPRDDSNNYPMFTTEARTDIPLIEAGANGTGVHTSSDDYRGTITSFWIKVYDAQGVPGNIESVTATSLNGIKTELYYEYNESGNCAIYSNNSYAPFETGTYTFNAVDKEGNLSSTTEVLAATPMGYPAESTLGVIVNGTGADFDWEEVTSAAFYRLEIYNRDHERILKFATTENHYTLAPGFLKKGEVYGFRITTRDKFWNQNEDNGSASPWSPYRAINFKTEPVMDTGSNLPEIDTGNFGVAATYLEHPVTGDPSYWLQFSVQVTDLDGVPENIKSVIVEGPGISGSLTLNYDSKREGNTAEYWNDIIYDNYDAIQDGGVYTFTVTDENGKTATTTDTLVKKEVPLVPYLTPADGAIISSDRPVIDWADPDPADGPYFYKVRIYTHWNTLVHQSGILENSSYILPGGILQPDTVYGYRIYAYDKDINTDDVDNVSINDVFFAKQNHFTVSDGESGSILTELFKLINVMIGKPADISSFGTDINQDNKLDMKDAIPILQEAGDLR